MTLPDDFLRLAGAGAALMALAACGGLSGDARTVAAGCTDIGMASVSECRCFARRMDRELDGREMADAAEIYQAASNEGAFGAAFDLGMAALTDSDANRRLTKIGNVADRALQACQ